MSQTVTDHGKPVPYPPDSNSPARAIGQIPAYGMAGWCCGKCGQSHRFIPLVYSTGRPTKIQTFLEFLETSRGNIFDGDVVTGIPAIDKTAKNLLF